MNIDEMNKDNVMMDETNNEPIEEVVELVDDATPVDETAEAETSALAEADTDTNEDGASVDAQPSTNQPAQEARASRRRRRVSDAELDYMGDSFQLSSVATNIQNEIANIEEIVANNERVSRTGRGEYRYMLAMMTGNDEIREDGDHNKLLSTHVYAIEVFQHKDAPDTYGSTKLVFEGNDFTAYSGIVKSEDESDSDVLRRQRSYTNHAPGSIFQCVPVKIVRKENGQVDHVICSRAFAMERMQDRFFFGDHPLAHEGGVAYAYVMAADDYGVRVECMGIETRINRGQLTSRQLITSANNFYKPGMKLNVVIRRLVVNKEERTIEDIQLSGVQYEIQQGLVRNVKDFDLAAKPHELAQVVTVTQNFYVVRLTASGIIGLIAHDNIRDNQTLAVNDNVWMEIVRVDEKSNRVLGNGIKIG